MALFVGARLGPYEILAPIGAGGMGEVFKARDTRLDRVVALKVSKEEFGERFAREARAIAALNHPNICHLYDVGPDYLVMEYVEGPDLRGPLDFAEALPIIHQLIDGIEAAHEKNIIHRDLKPSNIKITSDGAVKILDFGLAKAMDPQPASADPENSPTLTIGETQAGAILGTSSYMAPEQAKGKHADRRSDIWSFGVIVYELLTGKRPFTGETTVEILGSVLNKEPDWKPVPGRMRRLLQRCLQKDRKFRLGAISDARWMVEESREASNGPPPALVSVRNGKLGWIASGVLAVAGVASFFSFRAKPPELQVINAAISLPRSSDVTQFAFSPDGKRLALGLSINGKFSIWIRSLDSSQMESLIGDDEGVAPFWSPDGRYVGFFADGKLKIVSASGGPARVLCDADSEGGAWSQSGVIIFGSRTGPIKMVRADGGTSTPATNAEPGVYHYWPIFLPDGKHFLYRAVGSDESKVGVYLASLDDPVGRRLLGEPTSVAFAPGPSAAKFDYLLFRRGATLMAQPFDTKAVALLGDPFTVATGTSGGLLGNLGASAAPNGLLVYVSNGFGNQQYAPTWFDRSGHQLGKMAEGVSWRPISLSPNEKLVATQMRGGIWLFDVAGKGERRLTSPLVQATSAVWSPDSSHIAFSSGSELFLASLSGGTRDQPLLRGPNPKTPSDWSRDGHFLLYTDYDPNTGADIWFLSDPASLGEHKPMLFLQTKAMESRGQFSPDGKWVAYVSDKAGGQIFVRPFPSGTQEWQISPSGGSEPRWRRDGTEIYYFEGKPPRLRLMATPIRTEGGTFQPGQPKPLFEVFTMVSIPQANTFGYSPSADGQRFLVSVYAADSEPTLNIITNWQAGLKK